MRSIASHHLGASWWTEYAIDEDGEEVLLPEDVWTIHGVLQPGAPDLLSSRLTYLHQLARTEFSTVWAATMQVQQQWHPLPAVDEEGNGSSNQAPQASLHGPGNCMPVVVKV